jgi:endo-1,4-beta-xylanase
VVKQFNSITPENSLKWENVHPKEGKFNFEPVDSLVAFGERNKMFIIGHTLIWHSQVPKWVFEAENGEPASRDLLLKRMKEHILTVVGRYKGKIKGWDVINEGIEDNGGMRSSMWYEIIGEEYIEKAFAWAHEADPEAELYYNDYNMFNKNKCKTVVSIVKKMKSKGIKIDGIGLQGHWGLDYPPLDELDGALKAYSELGIKLMITEMDLDMLPSPGNYTGAEISKNFELKKELNPFKDGLPDSMQTVIANRYADFFSLFNKYKDNISRITFWGVSDADSWRNNWPVFGRTAYPLLFDRNMKPKKAFYSVIKTASEK